MSQRPDPAWHYAIVSLQDDEPALRTFRILEGVVTEESVTVR